MDAVEVMEMSDCLGKCFLFSKIWRKHLGEVLLSGWSGTPAAREVAALPRGGTLYLPPSVWARLQGEVSLQLESVGLVQESRKILASGLYFDLHLHHTPAEAPSLGVPEFP